MAKKRAIRNRDSIGRCDPAICHHCEYIGEGDFLCDKFEDEDGNPIVVIVDWETTDDYMRCRQGGDSEW